jgi:two-component system, chemotaxis family, protein-glutamate methylesterase/glutaminase
MNTSPIRAFVVDDSAFMRKMVSELLSRDPKITVVGTANNGQDALAKLASLTVDVVTLDIEMPELDGFGTLQEIMKRHPVAVVMLSSLTQHGADATIRCLELGAVDFIGKPSGSISLDIDRISAELIRKVKSAATVKFRKRTALSAPIGALHATSRDSFMSSPAARVTSNAEHISPRTIHEKIGVLVIGCSTGGPRALQTLVPMLPVNLGTPIVIIQHMPAGFTESLANRLDQTTPFNVREAKEGDRLREGWALVAPGGKHLIFDVDGIAHITDDPPLHGVKPSVDLTMISLSQCFGARTVSVLLTGMGKDGAIGMKALFVAGGITFAEDESTCVVYGMPKAAVDLGAVSHVLPLQSLAAAISKTCLATAVPRRMKEATT